MTPLISVALLASNVTAQDDASIRGRGRAVEEANRLANAGQLYAARRITDSLARVTPGDASDFAEILFARATFAPSVLDASLDYERIATELPSSRAGRASLLRLAQRSLVSSDAVKALSYLQRILREHPDDAAVAEAQYWSARALLDAQNVAAACEANHEALTHARAVHSALLPAIEAQGFVACGQAPLVQVVSQPIAAPTSTAPPKPIPATGKLYAVQVSAFALQRDAEAMATRLKGKGLDAHVDGSAKPFRVRVGRYSTFADAAKALADLKSKGISGFVSETNE